MSKVADFYAKVTENQELLAKVQEIADGTDYSELSDKQLQALSDLAKSEGASITAEEIKAHFAEGEDGLSLEALDAVAGGKSIGPHVRPGLKPGVDGGPGGIDIKWRNGGGTADLISTK